MPPPRGRPGSADWIFYGSCLGPLPPIQLHETAPGSAIPPHKTRKITKSSLEAPLGTAREVEFPEDATMKHKHSTVRKTGLRGAVMVEYALLLLLVALPMISAFVLVGKQMFKDYRAAQVAILSSKP